jgi:hypothetical protein
VFQKHVSIVSSVFFLYVVSVTSRCFKSRSSKCSGSPSGWCGSNFRQCFLTARWLVAAGRPYPCNNSGQWRLEPALGQVSSTHGPRVRHVKWRGRELHMRASGCLVRPNASTSFDVSLHHYTPLYYGTVCAACLHDMLCCVSNICRDFDNIINPITRLYFIFP